VKVFPIREIHNPDDATEREGPMGRGQSFHVEKLSVGGLLAMK